MLALTFNTAFPWVLIPEQCICQDIRTQVAAAHAIQSGKTPDLPLVKVGLGGPNNYRVIMMFRYEQYYAVIV